MGNYRSVPGGQYWEDYNDDRTEGYGDWQRNLDPMAGMKWNSSSVSGEIWEDDYRWEVYFHEISFKMKEYTFPFDKIPRTLKPKTYKAKFHTYDMAYKYLLTEPSTCRVQFELPDTALVSFLFPAVIW